jgi:hypothetical protein
LGLLFGLSCGGCALVIVEWLVHWGLFSFDEFDECSVWVFYERYLWPEWAEFVGFVGDGDVVFSHRGDCLFHVFGFEGDVVEDSLLVFGLFEFVLFVEPC